MMAVRAFRSALRSKRMTMRKRSTIAGAAVLTALLVLGCSPAQYARQADRAASGVIRSGTAAALGEEQGLDINYDPLGAQGSNDDSYLLVGQRRIPLTAKEPGVLTLQESLEIAFRNSLAFQSRREELFLAALAVANARRGWYWPELGGEVTGDTWREVQNKGGEANNGQASVGPTLTQRLRNGGVLGLAATLQVASDMLGGEGTSFGSIIGGTFTQPLLRGAWRDLAFEEVYRVERNFLISVYDYDRFTQTFAMGIFSNYYQVLRRRDIVANDAANVERLRRTVALTAVQVEAGGRSRVELDQAQQNLLDAEVRLEQSIQSYQDDLDRFKITLGLPVQANIELDGEELAALRQAGPQPLPFDEARAIEVAFSTRPDVLVQGARVRDAERNIDIAADAFLPRLDAQLGISAGNTGQDNFWDVRADRHTRRAQVVLEYPLDQTDNRDAYRSAQIAFNRARRDYTQFLDNVRLDVRQTYRVLQQTWRTYELQVRNVEIATRRTRLANLQQAAGLLSARDVLEAEEALRNARNGLTGALIDYTNTRMQFLARLGMIYVTDQGRVNERTEPYKFDRVVQRYAYLEAPAD